MKTSTISTLCIKKIYPTLPSLALLLTPILASEPPEETFKSALNQENITRIQQLITSHKIDINLRNKNGTTALILAINQENIATVKTLLKRKDINVNLQGQYACTPLMMAIMQKNEKIINLLLHHPAINVNLQGIYGTTPLILSIKTKNITTAKKLINRNDIDINLQNEQKNTALIKAVCHRSNIDLVKLLLTHKDININLQGQYACTPLMIAILRQHTKIVQLLLQRDDIDLNLQDSEKKTALAYIKRDHIHLHTPQHHNLYYINLVKHTQITPIDKNHALLHPTYLYALYAQHPCNQPMKQYTDILLISKLSHKLEKRQRPLFYQGCLLAYESKNSHYSIQAKSIENCKKPSRYQPLLDTELIQLLTGYLRDIKMKGVNNRSDWVHFIKCYLWGNNQFALQHNPPTMTLKQIHLWHKNNSPYAEWLDAANHTQNRTLFKIAYQQGKYEAIATKYLDHGLKQVGILQDQQQIFQQPITQFMPIIIAGLKALKKQHITS